MTFCPEAGFMGSTERSGELATMATTCHCPTGGVHSRSPPLMRDTSDTSDPGTITLSFIWYAVTLTKSSGSFHEKGLPPSARCVFLSRLAPRRVPSVMPIW